VVSLRPYQIEAENAILKEWAEHDKTLLVLPTGCGKTIVFADVAKQRTAAGNVLVLAHREELLTQAADKIKKSCGLDCSVEKAEKSCIGSPEKITVGSVQTLGTERRLARFDKNHFKTIIVDEAHHSMADTYKRVLEHFDSAKVLGVTATPDRSDMRNLGEYFETLAYEYTLPEAIREGYLCPIRAKTIPLKLDMSKVKTQAGDYSASDLGNALEPYLESIADRMAEECRGRHTVVFLPLVAMAQEFKDMLNERGLKACEVNGNSTDREQVLADFEAGKYDVICNAMLLTEGWDCPIVDTIVVLRPTKIRSLYSQMVGRGTRLSPGKDHLLLLDFLWMTGKHKLVKPADIVCKKEEIAAKINETIDESGEEFDLLEMEEKVSEDVRKQREEALRKQLEEEQRRAKAKSKLIDPLEFELSIMDEDLTDYVPVWGWEMEAPSARQLETLEKFGLDVEKIDNKGLASKLLDKCITRANAKLATIKQMQQLKKWGFKDVNLWTMTDASKIMGQLAANHWRLPYWINPATYVPDSMKKGEMNAAV